MIASAWAIAIGSFEIGLSTRAFPAGGTVALAGGVSLIVSTGALLAVTRSQGRIVPYGKYLSLRTGATLLVTVLLAVVFALAGRATAGTLNDGLGIPGEPGYVTFTGPDGRSMAVGDPWGTPCRPIVIAVSSGIPSGLVADITQVVKEARAAGVDVTTQNQQNQWFPGDLYPPGLTNSDVEFVPIDSTGGAPPELSDGEPEHIAIGWDADPSSDGKHEIITDLQGTLYLKALNGDAFFTRRSVRQLIAFSQGIDSFGPVGSGIAQSSNVDSFSARDIAAMQRMSGCRYEPVG